MLNFPLDCILIIEDNMEIHTYKIDRNILYKLITTMNMIQPQAPGAMGEDSKSKEKKKPKAIPKLIQNDKNSRLYRGINVAYGLFYIIKTFSGKILWFGSCVALMYLLPLNILLFKDQEMVLSRMAMSGNMPGMMGPAGM